MSEQLTAAKKDFSRIGLSLFAIGAITAVLQMVFSWLWAVSVYGTPLANTQWVIWLITFAPLYLIAIPVGVLLMRPVPAEQAPSAKLGAKRFWALMLMCIPIMYAGNIIGTLLSMLLSGGTAENALLNYINGSPLYTMLVVVLIAPALEEYIFRKQIIDRLGRYGERTAILLSAVTFGLFHMNLFQFFYAFGLGLIFAYVYTRTQKLRYPVVMHMLINLNGSVIAPWIVNRVDMEAFQAIAAGEFDLAQLQDLLPGLLVYMGYSGLLMIAVIAGAVLLIIQWKKRQLLPASQELPGGTAFKTAYLNLGMILFAVFCLVMIALSLFSGLL